MNTKFILGDFFTPVVGNYIIVGPMLNTVEPMTTDIATYCKTTILKVNINKEIVICSLGGLFKTEYDRIKFVYLYPNTKCVIESTVP